MCVTDYYGLAIIRKWKARFISNLKANGKNWNKKYILNNNWTISKWCNFDEKGKKNSRMSRLMIFLLGKTEACWHIFAIAWLHGGKYNLKQRVDTCFFYRQETKILIYSIQNMLSFYPKWSPSFIKKLKCQIAWLKLWVWHVESVSYGK